MAPVKSPLVPDCAQIFCISSQVDEDLGVVTGQEEKNKQFKIYLLNISLQTIDTKNGQTGNNLGSNGHFGYTEYNSM